MTQCVIFLDKNCGKIFEADPIIWRDPGRISDIESTISHAPRQIPLYLDGKSVSLENTVYKLVSKTQLVQWLISLSVHASSSHDQLLRLPIYRLTLEPEIRKE